MVKTVAAIIHQSNQDQLAELTAAVRTVAILAAAMSADDDVDTSEAHQIQAIQDIETSLDPALEVHGTQVSPSWNLVCTPPKCGYIMIYTYSVLIYIYKPHTCI